MYPFSALQPCAKDRRTEEEQLFHATPSLGEGDVTVTRATESIIDRVAFAFTSLCKNGCQKFVIVQQIIMEKIFHEKVSGEYSLYIILSLCRHRYDIF